MSETIFCHHNGLYTVEYQSVKPYFRISIMQKKAPELLKETGAFSLTLHLNL